METRGAAGGGEREQRAWEQEQQQRNQQEARAQQARERAQREQREREEREQRERTQKEQREQRGGPHQGTRPWWEVLGVSQGSCMDEVKAAYRTKIKQ
jgi:hypothetical protein